MQLAALVVEDRLSPDRIAGRLSTTKDDIGQTTGLGRDALTRKERVGTPRTQTRLRELVEILNRVEPRFASTLAAYAWLRSEPLAGFGGRTAMALLREGRANDVLDYIDAVDDGVFA